MILTQRSITYLNLSNKQIYRLTQRTVFVNGTVLNVNQIIAMRHIAHLHVTFLKNNKDTVESFNLFMLQALKIDFKCAQHFIGSAYPKRKSLLQDLITIYPGVQHQVPLESSFKLDYKYNIATACAYLLKTNKNHNMFRTASITVLEPSKEDLNTVESLSMVQTGQRSPDLCIIFDRGCLKFMDFKASLRYINKGHIVFITNENEYDSIVKRTLIEQQVLYKKLCPLLSNALKLELDKTDITWHQRNCNIQDFILMNLEKIKDINPSLIFKEDSLYEGTTQKKISKYDQYVSSKSFIDTTTTEETLVSLISTDDKALAMYNTSSGINSNIKKALLKISLETIENILNK
jgi:hypothetical protein